MLVSCKVCGEKVSKNADACPHCGEPRENIWQKMGGTRSGWAWEGDSAFVTIIKYFIGAIILAVILAEEGFFDWLK